MSDNDDNFDVDEGDEYWDSEQAYEDAAYFMSILSMTDEQRQQAHEQAKKELREWREEIAAQQCKKDSQPKTLDEFME